MTPVIAFLIGMGMRAVATGLLAKQEQRLNELEARMQKLEDALTCQTWPTPPLPRWGVKPAHLNPS
jgi:hypothetical protein